jgi:hypothetical protein
MKKSGLDMAKSVTLYRGGGVLKKCQKQGQNTEIMQADHPRPNPWLNQHTLKIYPVYSNTMPSTYTYCIYVYTAT